MSKQQNLARKTGWKSVVSQGNSSMHAALGVRQSLLRKPSVAMTSVSREWTEVRLGCGKSPRQAAFSQAYASSLHSSFHVLHSTHPCLSTWGISDSWDWLMEDTENLHSNNSPGFSTVEGRWQRIRVVGSWSKWQMEPLNNKGSED